jgi:hypothetical protein
VLAAVCFGVLLLAAVLSVWQGDFSPGEELISPGAKDIAVSQEDKVYPTSDRLSFDGGPEVVYVYLRVEDIATYEDLEARVGRTSRVSALGRLLGGGGLVVSKEGEERLSVTYGGASGVVKFAVRSGSGGRLPSGNYTVAVYAASGGAGENSVVARKYFVVGARHG